jgi:hypothetical protein
MFQKLLLFGVRLKNNVFQTLKLNMYYSGHGILANIF